MKNLAVLLLAFVLCANMDAAGAASNRVRYTYDAAGNIVAINRVDPEPLAITGFAPASGSAGTLVTIAGTGFSTSPGANTVRFNGVAAAVGMATPAALSVTVPSGASTGRIEVAVGAGTATSAQDFVVASGDTPAIPGIAPGDIIAAATLVADGSAQSLGLFTTNKYGLLLFDAKAGDWLSVQLANFAINPAGATIGYTIYRPDLTRVASGTLSASNLSIHLPQLGVAGRYALLLASGSAQVSLDAHLEANRSIPADGSSIAMTRGAGQTTRALIAAAAGEQKALMVSAMVPSGTSLDWTIALPNGSTFRRSTAVGPGATTMLPAFATTGTHTIVLAPGPAAPQSTFKVALLGGVGVAIDGAPTDVVIAGPGEGARLNFAGSAADNLGFGLARLALSPATETTVSFAVYKPDAAPINSGTCRTDGAQCSVDLAALPVSGGYSIIVQPVNGATGSMQAWLSRDVGGTLSSGGPLTVALARPGQNARLAFAGVAGAVIALQVRAVATSPASQGLLVLIYSPDGTVLASARFTGAGATIVPPPLPSTGTYGVFIESDPAAQGAATASMEVLLDPGQPLAIDGPTQTASINVEGGSVRFTFAGAAGQNLGLGGSAVALAGGADATLTVYKPDASTLTAVSCTGAVGRCGANLVNLPASGTYSIVVRSAGNATGSLGITLSSDMGGNLPVGSAFPLALERPGANARLSFTGTAGQTLRLSWTGVAIPGTTARATATVFAPNGAAVGATQLASGAAGTYDIPPLPAAGTYIVFVDPPVGAAMNATLTLLAR